MVPAEPGRLLPRKAVPHGLDEVDAQILGDRYRRVGRPSGSGVGASLPKMSTVSRRGSGPAGMWVSDAADVVDGLAGASEAAATEVGEVLAVAEDPVLALVRVRMRSW